MVIKHKAYQIPPTKKQETIVRRNKVKCKINLHPPLCIALSVSLIQIIIS